MTDAEIKTAVEAHMAKLLSCQLSHWEFADEIEKLAIQIKYDVESADYHDLES